MKDFFLYVKANAVKIHSFGLGFIQIKLSDNERIHVYCPEVNITAGEEEVHDHRYDFHSMILKGKLTNKIYRIVDGDDFLVTYENCSPIKAPKTVSPLPCNLKLLSSSEMTKGSGYFMEKDTLHRVETERCITHLKLGPKEKTMAKVIHKKGEAIICPFSANMDEAKLWELVEREFTLNY